MWLDRSHCWFTERPLAIDCAIDQWIVICYRWTDRTLVGVAEFNFRHTLLQLLRRAPGIHGHFRIFSSILRPMKQRRIWFQTEHCILGFVELSATKCLAGKVALVSGSCGSHAVPNACFLAFGVYVCLWLDAKLGLHKYVEKWSKSDRHQQGKSCRDSTLVSLLCDAIHYHLVRVPFIHSPTSIRPLCLILSDSSQTNIWSKRCYSAINLKH